MDITGTTTLSSDALFNNGGTVETSGLLQLDDSKIYGGTITDNGTVEITGFSAISSNAHLNISAGDQVTIDPTATLALSGATITGTTGATIDDGTSGSGGTIDVLSSSTITGDSLNDGSVVIATGQTLSLDDATTTSVSLTNNGTLNVDAGDTWTLAGGSVSGGNIDLAPGGAPSVAEISTPGYFAIAPVLSANGEYLAFTASTTLPGQDNGSGNDGIVELYNLATGQQTDISALVPPADLHEGELFGGIPSISGNGQYVVFEGDYPVPGQSFTSSDVFLYNSATQAVTLVQADAGQPVISANGQVIALQSSAPAGNGDDILVTNQSGIILDTITGDPTYVPPPDGGDFSGSAGSVEDAALSGNGQFVSFWTTASQITVNGTLIQTGNSTGNAEVYVYDTLSHTLQEVSVNNQGQQGNGDSGALTLPSDNNNWTSPLSGNGNFVVFQSTANNLVAGVGDADNDVSNIFLYDTQTGAITALTDSNGSSVTGSSVQPSISVDGSTITFASNASNLPGANGGAQTYVVTINPETGAIESEPQLLSTGFAGANNGQNVLANTVSDDGNFAAFGGAALAFDLGQFSIIPDTGQALLISASAGTINFSGLALTDYNAAGQTLTLTVSVTHGTLTPNAATPGVTIVDGNNGSNGTLELTGSYAAIELVLQSGVTYTPTGYNPDLPWSDAITTTVSDGIGDTATFTSPFDPQTPGIFLDQETNSGQYDIFLDSLAGTLDVTANSTLDTTLNGGTVDVASGVTLTLDATLENTTINNAGTLAFTGPSTVENVTIFGGDVTIASGVTVVLDDVVLDNVALTVNSEVLLSSATISGGTISIAATGELVATGVSAIDNATINNGGSLVADGTLDITAALSGAGTDTIENLGTLELAAANAQTVIYAGSGGTLIANGTITGGSEPGISAATTTGAAMAITINGAGMVTSTAADAVDATNSGGGGNISIIANGAVTGANDGINAVENGTGSTAQGEITIGGSGNITGQSGYGISAQQSTTGLGYVSIDGTGNVTGTGSSFDGILAEVLNEADVANVTVNQTGNVTGGLSGINALTDGTGDVSVTTGSNATVTGTALYGIDAESYGTGSISVTTAAGDTVNSASTSILAVNGATAIPQSAGSTVTISAYGTINTGTTLQTSGSRPAGILAAYRGAATGTGTPNANVNGNVFVNDYANITAAAGDGIRAADYGNGNVAVIVGTLNDVSGGPGTTIDAAVQYGIDAFTYFTGDISVSTTSVGDSITSGGAGILAVSDATALSALADSTITVTTNGTVSSGSNLDTGGETPGGIKAGYNGGTTTAANLNVTGNVIINNNANITAAAGWGIDAFNYGNGDVTVNDSAQTAVSGPTGIGAYQESGGTGDVDVTVAAGASANNGAVVTGTTSYGIEAYSAGTGNVSVTTGANDIINSSSSGILAINGATAIPESDDAITSAITVTAYGTINSGSTLEGGSFSPAGISVAYKGGSTNTPNLNVFGDITIDDYANVTASAGYGIKAFDYGQGNITIQEFAGTIEPTSGDSLQDGILAKQESGGSGNITITIDSGATVTGNTGISAQVTGTGNTVTITNYGTITGVTGEAVEVSLAADDTAILSNYGTITGVTGEAAEVSLAADDTAILSNYGTANGNAGFSGFTTGDVIDFPNNTYGSAAADIWTQVSAGSGAAGTLQIYGSNGIQQSTLNFAGTYAQDDFALTQDSGTGTEVVSSPTQVTLAGLDGTSDAVAGTPVTVTLSNNSLQNVTYTWLLDGAIVQSGSSDSYTPTTANEGQTVDVVISFTDNGVAEQMTAVAGTVASPYFWGSVVDPENPTSGEHLYGVFAQTPNGASSGELVGAIYGATASGYSNAGPDSVTTYLLTLDPFLLPYASSIVDGQATGQQVSTTTIQEGDFPHNRNQLLLASTSATNTEGIGFFVTENSDGVATINQFYFNEPTSGLNSSLTLSTPVAIETGLAGADLQFFTSFETNSSGFLSGTDNGAAYNLSWATYSGDTYTVDFQIFSTAAVTASNPDADTLSGSTPIQILSDSGVTSFTDAPAWYFRGAGSADLSGTTTAIFAAAYAELSGDSDVIKFQAYEENGTDTASGLPSFTITPNLSFYGSGATDAITQEPLSVDHTYSPNALQFVPNVGTNDNYAFAWNDTVTAGGNTYDQVEFAIYSKSGTQVGSTFTAQIADGNAQDIELDFGNH